MGVTNGRWLWEQWDDAVCSGDLSAAHGYAQLLRTHLEENALVPLTAGQQSGFDSWCADHPLAAAAVVKTAAEGEGPSEADAPTGAGMMAQMYIYLRASRCLCTTAKKVLIRSESVESRRRAVAYLEAHEKFLREVLEQVQYDTLKATGLEEAFCRLVLAPVDEAESKEADCE